METIGSSTLREISVASRILGNLWGNSQRSRMLCALLFPCYESEKFVTVAKEKIELVTDQMNLKRLTNHEAGKFKNQALLKNNMMTFTKKIVTCKINAFNRYENVWTNGNIFSHNQKIPSGFQDMIFTEFMDTFGDFKRHDLKIDKDSFKINDIVVMSMLLHAQPPEMLFGAAEILVCDQVRDPYAIYILIQVLVDVVNGIALIDIKTVLEDMIKKQTENKVLSLDVEFFLRHLASTMTLILNYKNGTRESSSARKTSFQKSAIKFAHDVQTQFENKDKSLSSQQQVFDIKSFILALMGACLGSVANLEKEEDYAERYQNAEEQFLMLRGTTIFDFLLSNDNNRFKCHEAYLCLKRDNTDLLSAFDLLYENCLWINPITPQKVSTSQPPQTLFSFNDFMLPLDKINTLPMFQQKVFQAILKAIDIVKVYPRAFAYVLARGEQTDLMRIACGGVSLKDHKAFQLEAESLTKLLQLDSDKILDQTQKIEEKNYVDDPGQLYNMIMNFLIEDREKNLNQESVWGKDDVNRQLNIKLSCTNTDRIIDVPARNLNLIFLIKVATEKNINGHKRIVNISQANTLMLKNYNLPTVTWRNVFFLGQFDFFTMRHGDFSLQFNVVDACFLDAIDTRAMQTEYSEIFYAWFLSHIFDPEHQEHRFKNQNVSLNVDNFRNIVATAQYFNHTVDKGNQDLDPVQSVVLLMRRCQREFVKCRIGLYDFFIIDDEKLEFLESMRIVYRKVFQLPKPDGKYEEGQEHYDDGILLRNIHVLFQKKANDIVGKQSQDRAVLTKISNALNLNKSQEIFETFLDKKTTCEEIKEKLILMGIIEADQSQRIKSKKGFNPLVLMTIAICVILLYALILLLTRM